MRESKVRIAIQIIQVLSTFKCALFAVVDRLSATTDASSRTRHNFYKVIVHFTGFDLANQFSCISKSADYCSSHCNIINLEICFLNAVIFIESLASDCCKCLCRRILTFDDIVSRPKCRLHNSTGCTEDDSGSGSLMHRAVTLNIYQCLWADMCRTDHSDQLTCGDNCINIMSCIFFIIKIHLTLCLLSHTWHNRYSIDLLRTYAQLLCKICLHNCTEHLLW